MKSLRPYIGRTVLVNVAGARERAFRGTLTRVAADLLVLDNAELVDPAGGHLDGQALIPTGTVTWVQVV